MRTSVRAAVTILVAISLSTSILSAQQIQSPVVIKEQIHHLERSVRSAGVPANASDFKLLHEKRNELRTSIHRQIGSLRIYQSTYGYRFSARERKAVTNLIRSLEVDLESLEKGLRTDDSLVLSTAERSHAPKSQPTFAYASSAYLVQDDPTPTSTPTPTPDPIIEKANKEKTIAEAEKAAAEARKAASEAETAAIAAKLAAQRAKLGLGPTDAAATATPPAGNITPTQGGKFIETQILADASARQATHQLVEQLCGPLPGFPTPNPTPTPIKALVAKPLKTLVINNSAERSSVEKYRAILAQVQFLNDEYKRLIDQAKNLRENLPESAEAPELAGTLLIPAATELVKNAATLINLFRTDTEFQDQTVAVTSRTIVTLLTNVLLSASTGQCKVESIFHPAIYPLSISADAKNGSLIKAYRDLLKKITDGDAEIAEDNKKVSDLTKRIADLNKEIAELKEKIEAQEKEDEEAPKKTRGQKKKEKEEPPVDVVKLKEELEAKEADKEVIEQKITRVKQAVAEIEAFKASLADVLKLLTAVDDATKLPLLASLIRAGRLSDILAKDDTYALDLDVKSSGTNRIRRNLFWNAKIAHSAGVSIDASLYSNNDEQVFGTVQPFYLEFTGSSQIRKQSGFRKLDEIRH